MSFWDLTKRKITPVVPGTLTTPLATGNYTYQFSFENGWYGCTDLFHGSDTVAAQIRVFLCQVAADGSVTNGTIRTIDHTNFRTDASNKVSTWKTGESSSLGSSINYKLVEPGAVMLFDLFATQDGSPFSWGDSGYSTEARVFVLRWDGTDWSVETQQTLDLNPNPFGLPSYTDYKFFPAGHASPFKDGMMMRSYCRVPTHDTLPEGRYVEWGQYVTYENGSFVVHNPFIITDIMERRHAYPTPMGGESHGCLIQIGLEDRPTGTEPRWPWFAKAMDENGVVDVISIDEFKEDSAAWAFSGEFQNRIIKVREDKFICFFEEMVNTFWPQPISIAELFFDGTNLSKGHRILYDVRPEGSPYSGDGILDSSQDWTAYMRSDGLIELRVHQERNYDLDENDVEAAYAWHGQFEDLQRGDYVSGFSSNPANWNVVEDIEHGPWDTEAIAFYLVDPSQDGVIDVQRSATIVPFSVYHYPELHQGQTWYREGLKGTYPDGDGNRRGQFQGKMRAIYEGWRTVSLGPQSNSAYLTAWTMDIGIIPPLRLKRRDDHNKYGSPRLRTPLVIQGSSKQSRQRIATPNTYW